VEQEAPNRLKFLFNEPWSKAEVVTRLHDDAKMSEAVRQQALDSIEHFAEFLEPP
jgi:hypothetical protein